MCPNLHPKAVSSTHTILSQKPFLEIVYLSDQNVPGLCPFPILPTTPNPAPLGALFPSGWLIIPWHCVKLLLQNSPPHHNVPYFHIFPTKLGSAPDREYAVLVLFILCMRHRAWNVGGPQSLCKGQRKKEVDGGWTRGWRSCGGTGATAWTPRHHRPKHLESWVYHFPATAVAHNPHQPQAFPGAPNLRGSCKWQQMPPFTPSHH